MATVAWWILAWWVTSWVVLAVWIGARRARARVLRRRERDGDPGV